VNLILLFERDYTTAETVRIHDKRLQHVVNVLRSHVGDELNVGLLNGPIGRGTISRLTVDALEMAVVFDREAPAPLPLTLILALPRPKMLRRVLFSAASMGIKKLYLINASRVEKSFWKSPLLREERLQEQLLLGLEQAGDTRMPEIFLRPLFKPFVEDELPGISRGTLALVAHPSAEQPCPRDVNRQITLAIGPEGGFIPYEIARLASTGFIPVSIGSRTLRVETVVPALLSRLC